MTSRIKTIETITLPTGSTIDTRERVDFPTKRDVQKLLVWIGTCKVGQFEITRPVVDIRENGSIVDYCQSESATITIKLNGE